MSPFQLLQQAEGVIRGLSCVLRVCQRGSRNGCDFCRTLEAAVRWCVELQLALLHVDWPEAMLRWPDCAPEADPSTGGLLFRGLRVRMGMAFGRAQHRKPLNTGGCSRRCQAVPPFQAS